MTKDPANLAYALRLRCPHCGETPLLEPGSWLTFRDGCRKCNYTFEREPGYFTGASWVINYTVAGVTAAGAGALLLWQAPGVPLDLVIGIAAAVGIAVAIGFFPVAKALWMWLDHKLHPLGT
jgi:uncharacterized protein (DUF983 family)